MGDTITVSDVHVEKGTDDVVEYIRNNHYSGTCNPISNKWSLKLDDGTIVGGIVFANPMSEQVREFISENKKEVTELHRLHTQDRCGKNVESWFIAKSLKLLKKKKPKYRYVISYADSAEGHEGTVYQATNALYIGNTDDGSSHGYYIDEDGNRRSKRQGGENITVAEAKERGWEKKEASGKHRYVFPLPDQYESYDDCVNDLKPDPQPYP